MDQRGDGDAEAWRRLEDEAAHVEVALRQARERLRVARWRADDRRARGEQARLAGQEAFAVGLLDAADAHDATARRAERDAGALAAHHRALQRAADAARLRASLRRPPPSRGGAPEGLA